MAGGGIWDERAAANPSGAWNAFLMAFISRSVVASNDLLMGRVACLRAAAPAPPRPPPEVPRRPRCLETPPWAIGDALRCRPSPAPDSAGGLGEPGMPGDGERDAVAGWAARSASARGDEEPERPLPAAVFEGDGVPFRCVALGLGVCRGCLTPGSPPDETR